MSNPIQSLQWQIILRKQKYQLILFNFIAQIETKLAFFHVVKSTNQDDLVKSAVKTKISHKLAEVWGMGYRGMGDLWESRGVRGCSGQIRYIILLVRSFCLSIMTQKQK